MLIIDIFVKIIGDLNSFIKSVTNSKLLSFLIEVVVEDAMSDRNIQF